MISGLVQVLLFQGIGELASKFLAPALPGPVIGLVLLLAYLTVKGRANASLALVADAFSQYLGLLFVPAAVGVVLYLPQLRANALAVVGALVGSVVLTIAGTALIARLLSRGERSRE